MHEISDEMIEALSPSPPCPNCSNGSIEDVEREHFGDTVEHRLCTSCWMTEDGEWFLPPKRESIDVDETTIGPTKDTNRPEYRKSGKKIMCGAHPAYDDTEEDYGTDDGTADFEQFVTA